MLQRSEFIGGDSLRSRFYAGGLPMISQEKGSKEASRQYKTHLKAYGLDHKKMAELDALEAFYPKGMAGFCEDLLAEYSKDVSDAKEAP